MDEISYTGGKYILGNKSYYLDKDTWYWILSSHSFDGDNAMGFGIGNNGTINIDYVNNINHAIVPVI